MSLKSLLKTLAIATSLIALAAAGTQAAEKAATKAAPKTAPAVTPATSAVGANGANGGTGKVLECMDSGGYTYVKVDLGSGKGSWAAAPQFKVKKGATVTVPQGMPMANFESKTLKRTFDVVYFVDHVDVKK